MAGVIYSAGTLSFTNGSKTVTGSGTDWVSNVLPGWIILIPGEGAYVIDAIASGTSLTLTQNYPGTTRSGVAYDAIATGGANKQLLDQLQNMINQYTGISGGIGQGKFGDGTVSTPGLRFENDPDTGIFRPGNNKLALAAGGTQRAEANTSGFKVSGALEVTGNQTVAGNSTVSGTQTVTGALTSGGKAVVPESVSYGASQSLTEPQKTQARSNIGLVKVSNNSDATADRVLMTGTYGLGTPVVINSSNNLNTMKGFGIFIHSSGSIPSNVPESDAGVLIVIPMHSGRTRQIWMGQGDYTSYIRMTDDQDDWLNWERQLNTSMKADEALARAGQDNDAWTTSKHIREALKGIWEYGVIQLVNVGGPSNAVTADALWPELPEGLQNGQRFRITWDQEINAGGISLKINDEFAVLVVREDGNAPTPGQLIPGLTSILQYNSTTNRLVLVDGEAVYHGEWEFLDDAAGFILPYGLHPKTKVNFAAWGGGGGGGANSSGGGGGGGAYSFRTINFEDVVQPINITIGLGGAINGVGGTTTISNVLDAYGGGNGANASNGGGGGGGGWRTAGQAGAGTSVGGEAGYTRGGRGGASPFVQGQSAIFPYGGGGGGRGSDGGDAIYGGAGGGGTSSSGGTSIYGGNGGNGGTSPGEVPGGGGGRNQVGGAGKALIWID